MVRRIALVTLFAMLSIAAGGGAATAGGAVFEIVDADGDRVVRGEEFVQPGEVVTAHTSFSPHIAGLGGVDDAPYVLYLLPGSRFVDPGSLPPKAIALGQLEIVRGRLGTVARISFTVPRVPTGEYTMSVCNDPCTADGLGDIVGGWLGIAQTTKESRLIARLDDVKRERAVLNHALSETNARARELGSLVREAAGTSEDLRGRIAALEARLRTAGSSPPHARPLIEWWATALVALGFLALTAAFVIRGRARRPRPPGTNGMSSLGRPVPETEPVEEPTQLVGTDR
jgi:hypothetical protein